MLSILLGPGDSTQSSQTRALRTYQRLHGTSSRAVHPDLAKKLSSVCFSFEKNQYINIFLIKHTNTYGIIVLSGSVVSSSLRPRGL